ncbi:MAG: L-fucose/L-arabinose isomerase family protein [Kiritimatiellae bacterium]|nr:L-fucose/L-arabinose isomerase family protein [Kiritimatiellia bacterium]
MAGVRHKVRIGLYTTGLKAYWPQFKGLRERLEGYGRFIADGLRTAGGTRSAASEDVEVFNFGLVDCSDKGIEAGEYFQRNLCDIIFQHIGTYVTSDAVLPVHQTCKAPTVILNLQPAVQVNYARTTTGEWLAHCNACPAPEIANAFNRAGIPFRVVSGLLGLRETPGISMADEATAARPEAVRAWREIREWVRAASVKAALSRARFGFLGGNYSGMLDMYSDFTLVQGATGLHVEILEMCDLKSRLAAVTDADARRKLDEIKSMFEISEDSPADPLARRPTPEQLDWSARVAAAQERLVADFAIDALAYYYHGADGNEYEQIQSGFIVGHSLLTANGVPCAGEGDLKTALAMKICDLLGVGGSFCEIVTTDYLRGTVLVGHDGPFHLAIAKGRPILRGLGLYHGKRGSGVSVEAKVKDGPVTTLGVTQTAGGGMKFIVSEAEATDDPIMAIGNTQTHVRIGADPDTWFERWLAEAPIHHFAMSVGRNVGVFAKVADLLGVPLAMV